MGGPVTVEKTLASIRMQLDAIRERLGPRAGLDMEGLRLLHETNALLLILNLATDKRAEGDALTMAELTPVVNRTAKLAIDFDRRLRGERQRMATLNETEAALIRQAMREAQEGPSKATLVKCPACDGCTLCHDVHMVTPAIATEWKTRNEPRKRKR